MTDQTVASLSTQTVSREKIYLDSQDREIIRSLASQVRELADLPEQEEKRKLWYKHNALEKTRPVIFCDPENGWNEIITPDDLRCTGELAREWEMKLRKEIFWGKNMGDDKVIDFYFNIPYVYTESGWGLQEKIIKTEEKGSYRWDPPLKDLKIWIYYISLRLKLTTKPARIYLN